ncbi:hypothetical protein FGE12_28720 [Aggregicoccus sp. 17bor-14]|nr:MULTISPECIES: aspartyl protease family protein [Myxococcaceae]MBF5046431.1 aspartyl protease family protein [Simulacricoccus sp. 17bor-14]MRI92150.1 hypothetical protein [Aggregicoccus sp. 17bor-14]
MLLLLAFLAGCAHAPPALSPQLTRALAAAGPGHFVTGEVAGLSRPAVLDRSDFTYALAWAPGSARVAFSHLAAQDFRLSQWALGEDRAPQRARERSVGPVDFEVEGLAYAPDGRLLAAVGRDGQVHLYDAESGEERSRALLDGPLVSVAFHPQGRALVVGSAAGQLTVLEVPGLAFVDEVQGHADEVRGLDFAPDGTLYSGGWDGHLRSWEAQEGALEGARARLAFERAGGYLQVRGVLQGRVSLPFAVDLRAPALFVTAEAAGAAGLDVGALAETRVLPTPLGSTQVRVARGLGLRFKGLRLEGLEVVVCDACVPAGAQGVLGAPFAERVEMQVDEAARQVQLALRGAPAQAPSRGLRLRARGDVALEGPVNDLSVDARGERLGVALSATRAQRTVEVYQRERAGLVEPPDARNAALLVEARSGRVLQRWARHAGVVSTAGISPDGRSVASGGWDKRLFVFTEGAQAPRAEETFGFSVRQVRFSPDGRRLGVAAWTPQTVTQESDPAAVLYDVAYRAPALAQ